jgi:DNA-binding CsgD family transcriptional regulator
LDVNGVFRGYRGIDRDITERKRAEEELRKAHDEMGKKVEERTKELLESNEQLRREIENRGRVENRLRKSEKELREHTEALEEANIALRVLLSHRDEEKKRLEDTVLSSLQKLITPYLQRLKETTLSTEQQAYVDILETNLYEVASPFTDKLSSKCPGITPRELEIAGLIKAGKTNVEIADLLGITESAISFHRKNIRSKLGLKHKKVNLRSYLLSLV